MSNDGGPAFPVLRENERGGLFMAASGMTLRDYFAAAALTGILSENMELCDSYGQAGKRAYDFADAMLAEREVKP